METQLDKIHHLERLVTCSFPFIPNFLDQVNVDFEVQENSKSFWSEIFVAHLKPKTTDLKDLYIPKAVFIKIPKFTENLNRGGEKDKNENHDENLIESMKFLSKREADFLNIFANKDIPYFPIPKCYYVEEYAGDGTGGLVSENLIGQVHSLDYIPGYNDSQVLRIIQALAGFHSYTIQLQNHTSIDIFKESTAEMYSSRFQELMFSEALCFEKLSPEVFGNDRITNMKWSFDYEYKNKTMDRVTKEIPNVLVHSDLNITNLLWNNSSKSDDLRAIIDFQMVHEGSVVHDLIRTLTLGLSRKDRENNTEKYLKHYYSTLTNLFDNKPPFSFERLRDHYKLMFPIVSNFTLFGISIYYKMYEDGLIGGDKENKDHCKAELLSRAEGIVEDIERLGKE